MASRFKNRMLRDVYEGHVRAYHANDPALVTPDGNPRRMGSMATWFWNGYYGHCADKWDRPSKQMAIYASWCAGRDMRRAEDEAEYLSVNQEPCELGEDAHG